MQADQVVTAPADVTQLLPSDAENQLHCGFGTVKRLTERARPSGLLNSLKYEG